MYYEINAYDTTYHVQPRVAEYMDNHTLAISLVTDIGEPYCHLTVNLMESDVFASNDTAFVDTNNCPWAEEFIISNGLGEPLGLVGHSGFCTYPLYKFNMDKLTARG